MENITKILNAFLDFIQEIAGENLADLIAKIKEVFAIFADDGE